MIVLRLIIKQFCRLYFLILFSLCLLLFPFPLISQNTHESQEQIIIRIGVLSHRGDDTTILTWNSLAKYLTDELFPQTFEIVPLDFDEIEIYVANKSIDFLLVNSGIYVAMEVQHRISRLVTLNKLGIVHGLNLFGGVAFTLNTNKQINSFNDLPGKTFVAVDSTSLGGYQMVVRELIKSGIDPENDLSEISFAGTHDQVVMAVLNKEYDAGTVRTGILEKMAEEGQINLNNFKIIEPQNNKDFPFMLSTRLYPEWPFSKLRHTSNELAQKVAVALLNMPDQHNELKVIDYTGWTVPLDYQEVHELFKELHIPPYQKADFTLIDALKKYWPGLAFVLLLLLILSLMSYWILRLNRRLKINQYNLEQEHYLVLDSVGDGIYGVDLKGNCTFINRAMENMTGWTREDMIGKAQHQILHHTRADGSVHPSYECPVYQTYKDNQSRFIEDDIFWKKNGKSFPVEYCSTPVINTKGQTIGSVVVFRDISEKKQLEEQDIRYRSELAHMGRLNTLGGMASGLAHELNQPLTAITTNAYASIQMLESGNSALNSKIIDTMEKITQHGERAGNIIKHLRELTQKDSTSYSSINVHDLIHDVIKLLRAEIKKNQIKINLNFDKMIPPIECQPIQIDQVVLNLCKNAIESMPEHQPNKLLTIETKMLDQHKILVSIEDNGLGIEQRVLNELFEPFISNKNSGMGLGLNICKGIIEAHAGELYLKMTQNGCTIFNFELPVKQNK